MHVHVYIYIYSVYIYIYSIYIHIRGSRIELQCSSAALPGPQYRVNRMGSEGGTTSRGQAARESQSLVSFAAPVAIP